MRHGVDGNAMDARRSIDAGARDGAVRAPIEPIRRARRSHPDLVRRQAESNSRNASVEDALQPCGGDALAGGDDARVRHVAMWCGGPGWLLRLRLNHCDQEEMEHGSSRGKRYMMLPVMLGVRHRRRIAGPRGGRRIYSRVYSLLYSEVTVGVPLMLQEADARRIEALKKQIGARTKVEVVRTALDLLEREAERSARVVRWERAVKITAATSRRALAEFRSQSRLHKID